MSSNMGDVSALTPLLSDSGGNNISISTKLEFYDSDMMTDISADIAHGYLILLTGGGVVVSTRCRPSTKEKKKSKKKSKSSSETNNGQSSSEDCSSASDCIPFDELAVDLAFMAISDGNIVDACFGVGLRGREDRSCCIRNTVSDASSARANDAVRRTKDALREAGYQNDGVKSLAVKCYVKCFVSIVRYHQQRKKFGVITQCFRRSHVERDALEEIDAAFRGLNEAVEAAM